MYFVHPQIELKKIGRAISALFKVQNKEKLFQKLSLFFPEKQLVFTDMARTAFKIIVEKLNLQNSKILFPAYICDIFYPIFKQYNIQPIFLDIDLRTFHIKIDEVEKKIVPKTKAILVCHTYGLPFNIKTIRALNISDLLIIEDCAHSFGVNTGNFGDATFFSLYKQFPTLRGGLLICPKEWDIELSKTFFNFRDLISFLNCFSFFAYFFKKFGGKIAPKMIRKEKLSVPGAINKVSLNLFSAFLEDFEKSLPKRKELALFFQEELKKLNFMTQKSENNVFCYLSALVPEDLQEKRDKIVQKLRKYKVFCTRIWKDPIILNKEAQREYRINLDEFPQTLEAAKRIINFPLQNYYTEKDIQKIINSLRKVIYQL